MPTTPRVRVVVQLPYNRPDEPHPNPPHIEWNAEKANILWEVIALSRTSDNGGTDWKGLAAHLEVPLPYLLYRAQARYEEDLRGLQDIRGVLSTPTSVTTPLPAGPSTLAIPAPRSADATPTIPSPTHPLTIKIPPSKLAGVAALGARRLSTSQMMATPLGVRARLNSLTHKSPSKPRGGQGYGKTASSSIATLQGNKRSMGPLSALPLTSSPLFDEDESDSSDEEEQAQRKEEELERQAEEQEHLDKKLVRLQKMMTSERLGLVRSPVYSEKGKEREDPRREEIVRGRPSVNGAGGATPSSPSKLGFNDPTDLDVRLAEFTSTPRNRDHSASVSSASSPQGSIPSIPSPSIPSPSPPPAHRQASSPHGDARIPIQHQTQVTHLQSNSQPPLVGSPIQRHLSPTKSSSPPATSMRNARGHAHTRQTFGALGAAGVSEGESNQGSSASSFSDLSDASLSASALESALMSNIRGTGSRLSAITRSRLGGRGIRQ
ncbi:hypothetical protein JVU11DRAFT_1934 [Chiua virens]|nr:hypothetical protein JVU11DRAFT_1934 [Chiua virens]